MALLVLLAYPVRAVWRSCMGAWSPAAGRSQNVTTDPTQTLAAAPVERATQGCAFVPRCSHALQRCWNERPLYRTPGGVGARCFLHDVSGSRA